MKLLITPGPWEVTQWGHPDSYDITFGGVRLIAEDARKIDALAISRVPEMLAFIAKVNEVVSPYEAFGGFAREACALLEGLAEKEKS